MKINKELNIISIIILSLTIFFISCAIQDNDREEDRNEKISLKKWSVIEAGNSHALGILKDGTLRAWGYNVKGQLGDGTTIDRRRPVQIGADTWTAVSTGTYHTLGIKSDGSLWSWGSNEDGELGLAITDSMKLSPQQIGIDKDWTAISTGNECSMALKKDGSLWTWGSDINAQLGNGPDGSSNSPVHIAAANQWQAISCGTSHSLALNRDGTIWGWGFNM